MTSDFQQQLQAIAETPVTVRKDDLAHAVVAMRALTDTLDAAAVGDITGVMQAINPVRAAVDRIRAAESNLRTAYAAT